MILNLSSSRKGIDLWIKFQSTSSLRLAVSAPLSSKLNNYTYLNLKGACFPRDLLARISIFHSSTTETSRLTTTFLLSTKSHPFNPTYTATEVLVAHRTIRREALPTDLIFPELRAGNTLHRHLPPTCGLTNQPILRTDFLVARRPQQSCSPHAYAVTGLGDHCLGFASRESHGQLARARGTGVLLREMPRQTKTCNSGRVSIAKCFLASRKCHAASQSALVGGSFRSLGMTRV